MAEIRTADREIEQIDMKVAPKTTRKDLTYDAVWCESAGDFTLPDYMPEIGKMLSCTPRILPSGKYIGTDRAEFSGSIIYSVIYTGEDGVPFYTTLCGEYEYSVMLGAASESEGLEMYDELALESVSIRPSGPRKFSVKARIKSVVHAVFDVKQTFPEAVMSDDASCQRLIKSMPTVSYCHYESGEFSLSEEFKLDASAEAEPVGCEGVVCISEISCISGAVVCRGEVECRVLYFDIEGGRRKLTQAKRKLRFEREIASVGLADAGEMRAYGRVISTEMSTAEDGGELLLSVTVNLYADRAEQRQSSFLCDIFSCDSVCDTEYEDTEYRTGVLCKNHNLSFHGQKKLPEENFGMCSISDVSASARIDETEVLRQRVQITGEIIAECIVCCASEDSTEYSLVSVPIPFKCEIPLSETAQKYEMSIITDAAGVRARVEKDSISVDAELYLSMLIRGLNTIQTVKSAEPSDQSKLRSTEGITVYYPDKGETLWSVAKKHAVDVGVLANMNEITVHAPDSPQSLEGVRSLIIM